MLSTSGTEGGAAVTLEVGTGVVASFKAAFRGYPTGVAVIAAAGPDGPVGLTASSVASVSLAPPALSFSVMDSPSARLIVAAGSFVVHLLGAAHEDLARQFAQPGGRRFTADQPWTTLPTGEPLLHGVPAALRCTALHRLPVGSSTVVVAEVADAWIGPADAPLTYREREFHTSP
ncbi:flavin reductase family protein [Dactylosporangium maewongense]|uniref:flavin reductase family protein n=1 Tax=Dactylosporangium maewongense TaxID=634393 RepID=UPI0031E1F4BA